MHVERSILEQSSECVGTNQCGAPPLTRWLTDSWRNLPLTSKSEPSKSCLWNLRYRLYSMLRVGRFKARYCRRPNVRKGSPKKVRANDPPNRSLHLRLLLPITRSFEKHCFGSTTIYSQDRTIKFWMIEQLGIRERIFDICIRVFLSMLHISIYRYCIIFSISVCLLN